MFEKITIAITDIVKDEGYSGHIEYVLTPNGKAGPAITNYEQERQDLGEAASFDVAIQMVQGFLGCATCVAAQGESGIIASTKSPKGIPTTVGLSCKRFQNFQDDLDMRKRLNKRRGHVHSQDLHTHADLTLNPPVHMQAAKLPNCMSQKQVDQMVKDAKERLMI